ncbi:MAG: sugar phosphate nucleotidyltransferase [Candidatus Kryptoniota bacterium]
MKAVIMAGGLGQRLRPFTQVIPKPLLPVGEQSVLEIIIQALSQQGFDEIFLALNYQSDLFEAFFGDGSKWGIKISYTKEEIPLGTAGPLKLIDNRLTEPFLVINGDILTNLEFTKLADFHRANEAILTVCTKEIHMPLHYGVVHSENNRIVKIDEKPDMVSEVIAGIYMLSPETLSYIPKDAFYTMVDLLHDLMKADRKVVQYHLGGYYWLDIGQMDDYQKAQDLYREGIFSKRP